MRARLPSRASGRSLVLLLPTLIAITAVAAACGGSTRSASVSTTTTTVAGRNRSSTAAAARAKFASCLEAHGVPASQATQGFGFRRSVSSATTGSGPGGSGSAPAASTPPTTSAAYAAAFQACRSDLPARPAGGGFQNSAAGRAYLQCLQLHGVTLPSTPPTSNASGSATAPGGSATGPGGGFRSMTSDPAFQAARAACAPLAPNRAGDAGTTSTTAAA